MCNLSTGLLNRGKAEGLAKGKAEGLAKGDLNRAKRMAFNLHALGMSNDNIAKAAEVSVDTVSKWLSEPHATPAI